jgi:hypothetical protein
MISQHLWLRWYDANGWIPTESERAAEQQLLLEPQSNQKLREYLHSQGIDPDNLPL